MAYTYILRLSNGMYYVGSTYNLQHRLLEHQSGQDFFTKQHLPVTLVYQEMHATKEDAAKREYQLNILHPGNPNALRQVVAAVKLYGIKHFCR